MSFQPETGAWSLLDGPAGDHTIADTRATILRYVRDHPGSKPLDISNGTGLDRENTRRTCSRMAADGQLNASNGAYTAPPGTA